MEQQSGASENGVANPVDAHVESVNKLKHDWYQTETDVVITVLLKNVDPKNVQVSFTETTVSLTVKQSGASDYSLELDLAHPVVAEKSTYSVLKTKIEVKLKKRDGGRWSALEGDGTVPLATAGANVENDKVKAVVTQYPSSSHKQHKNWDRLAKEVEEEEENEKPEGDAAVNKLFQKIYGDSNEDVKKAMMKSYLESGGTVLSTNWDEVSKGHVDCKPPDGMEYKKW